MAAINSLETVCNIDSKYCVSELKFKHEWNTPGQMGAQRQAYLQIYPLK